MNAGQSAPRTRTCRGCLRERAWWVMREARVFTLRDLLHVVADGDERAAASNLRKWLGALTRAGTIAEAGRAEPASPTSNGEKRWRVVRNTGPKAPVWRQDDRVVFDPNTGTAHPMEARHG